MDLIVLPQVLAIARLDPQEPLPVAVWQDPFWAIVKTEEELSIVCSAAVLQGYERIEPGWRALKVLGPLDFALVGILASLAAPLAAAQISIFAISTFDTDYLLVKQTDLQQAIQVLSEGNHRVIEG